MTARAIIALAAAAAAAACGARSTPLPEDPQEPPAVTWSTAVSPYRLPGRPSAVLVEDTRVVVSVGAAIAAVDLATGAMTAHATKLDSDVVAIISGPDGAPVLVVEKDERLSFHAIEDDLSLRPLRDDPDTGWSRTSLAVAADGRLAMSANGRPLVVYDADGTPGATMLVAGVADTGWDDLAFADGGKRLLAHHGSMHSFDLATGVATAGADGDILAASDGTTAVALIDTALTLIDARTAQPIAELAKPAGPLAVMSRDGALVARLDDTSVMIHDTASRRMIARYALGPSHDGGGHLAFTPAGDRVVIVSGAVVRVLDIDAGTLTDPGDGPYELPAFVRLTRDRLIAGDDRVRSWPVNGGAPALIGPDESSGAHGAVSPSAGWIVTSRALPKLDRDAPTEIELTSWPLTGALTPHARFKRVDSISSIAIEDTGEVLIGAWRGADGGRPGHNVIDQGGATGAWRRLVEVHYDGYIDKIDAATRLAAISSGGSVRVIELPGTRAIASADIPSCDSGGAVHLDGAGRRIATDDDKTLWVFSFAETPATKVGAAGLRGRIGDVAFVPGRTEVVVDLDERIAIWDYTGGPVISTPVDGVIGRLAVDPGGTRVAAAQSNGRIHVFALADLRNGTPEPTIEAASDQRCLRDPLEPPGDRHATRRTWEPGVAP